MLDLLLLDVRHALRAVARSPLVVVVAVVSIGAGVGVNTAVFSWMDSLVLHPFPAVNQPDRVVGVETLSPGGAESPVSYPMVREWGREARSISAVAAWTIARAAARSEGDRNTTPLVVMQVSASYFGVLGVRPSLGRALTEADERTRAPVVVLGHELWQRRWDGDPGVVGRPLFLNGAAFTVVGVAPPRFAGTYVGVVPDVFVPVSLQPTLLGVKVLDDRRARSFQAVARLAPGVTSAECERELDGIARRISDAAGDRPVVGVVVKDIRTQYLGGILLPILTATLVVTGMLLLIGCANVATLFLVRFTARGPELALRVALGASPWRLTRVILLEVAVITIVGALVGVALAHLTRGTLASLFPMAAFPITLPVELNGRVLAFALGCVVVSAALCSWVPVRRASVAASGAALRSSRSPTRASTRGRSALVSLQLAFSLLCVVTAGAFARGLQRSGSVDLGFTSPRSVLLVGTDLGVARLDSASASVALQQLLTRTRTLPGVVNASAATAVPLGVGGVRTTDVRVEGYTPGPDESMSAARFVVGSAYARTMGIRVVSGRDVTDADRPGTVPVALINETFASRFWPNATAVGRRVDAGHGWATVVGVVADGKYGSLSEARQLAVYLALAQWPQNGITLHIRAAGEPMALVPLIRDVLTSVHVDLPALQARTLATHIAGATFVPRVGVRVLGAFAVAALVLAAFGLYGALAITVAMRARDFAIRAALGARPAELLRSIGDYVGRIVVVGLVPGTGLTLIAAHLLRRYLPDVGVVDRVAYFGAVGIVLAAVVLAAVRPANRLLRTDPVTALRGD